MLLRGGVSLVTIQNDQSFVEIGNCGLFYCKLWAVQNFARYNLLAIFLAHSRKKSCTLLLALTSLRGPVVGIYEHDVFVVIGA